jgi:hypothetical protein
MLERHASVVSPPSSLFVSTSLMKHFLFTVAQGRLQREKNRKLHKQLATMKEERAEAEKATMSDALTHVSTANTFPNPPPLTAPRNTMATFPATNARDLRAAFTPLRRRHLGHRDVRFKMKMISALISWGCLHQGFPPIGN